jgi:hypothetical protein
MSSAEPQVGTESPAMENAPVTPLAAVGKRITAVLRIPAAWRSAPPLAAVGKRVTAVLRIPAAWRSAPPLAAVGKRVTAVLRIPAAWRSAPPLARATALARLQSFALQIVPQLQYHLTRLGTYGQAGLVGLTAAAVIAVSALMPAREALHTLSADLVRAQHASTASSVEQAVPRLIGSLPTRAQMPTVLGQVFAQATAAGVALDSGRYLYIPAKAGMIARYEVEFPVKARYPDIRTFIDRTLTAVPAAALEKLRVERKRVGDAVVNADIGFVVFVRSE